MEKCSTSGRKTFSWGHSCSARSLRYADRSILTTMLVTPQQALSEALRCFPSQRRARRSALRLARALASAQRTSFSAPGSPWSKPVLALACDLHVVGNPHYTSTFTRTLDDAGLSSAPSPSEPARQRRRNNGEPPPPPGTGPSVIKVLYNRVLRRLSSLPLAIGELGVIAALSAIGTIIEQNKDLDYYMKVRPLPAHCSAWTTIQ